MIARVPDSPVTGHKKNGKASSVALDVIATVSSLAAGAVSTKLYIEEKVSKNITRLGGFDQLNKEGREAYNQLAAKVDHAVIDKPEALKQLNELLKKTNK